MYVVSEEEGSWQEPVSCVKHRWVLTEEVGTTFEEIIDLEEWRGG